MSVRTLRRYSWLFVAAFAVMVQGASSSAATATVDRAHARAKGKPAAHDFVRAVRTPGADTEYTLTVTKLGNAGGLVFTEFPPGIIYCGDTCVGTVPAGEYVALDAFPETLGARFSGWGGACSGLDLCEFPMDGPVTVTATFDLEGTIHPMSVSVVGPGTVRSESAGIDCGSDCDEPFTTGSLVRLIATPSTGHVLQAWEGDCTGRSECVIAMNATKNVTARFVAGPFAEAVALTGEESGHAAWGDYDNDGDLDLVVTSPNAAKPATLYRNDGGTLVDSGVALLAGGDFAQWGDYDNDGDLDLLLGGSSAQLTQLYRNDGGAFVAVPASFAGKAGFCATWGDYDNDGDLDLVLAHAPRPFSDDLLTTLYRNDHGVFVDSGTPLVAVQECTLAWGDYDNDGDPDLVVAGLSADGRVSVLYRNDHGVLADSGASLPGTISGSVAWADYDGDGDLDLAIAGDSGDGYFTKIFRNDGGALVDSGIALPSIVYGAAVWGDSDSDGDPDLLITGLRCTRVGCWPTSALFRNDGGAFVETFSGLPEMYYSTAAWGDYDNDGRLDLVMLGLDPARAETDKLYTGVFRNLSAPVNTPPLAPALVGPTAVAEGVRLEWQPGVDAETPSAGLSYNLRVGTTAGGSEVVSPMSAPAGQRRLPQDGNAGRQTTVLLAGLAHGRYYWGAQAVDTSWAGSPFSSGTFDVNQLPSAHAAGPVSGNAGQAIAFDGLGSSDPDADPLTYRWDFGDGATGTGATPSHVYAHGGSYPVTLVVNDGFIDSASATTTATIGFVAPRIAAFSPRRGMPGTSVRVTGSGLNGATAVTFGGVAAAFTVESDVALTAVVPLTAVSGPIVVANPSASASSANRFVVVPPPALGVGDVRVREGNVGSRTVFVTVALSTVPQQTVTVAYAIGGGTATLGQDYSVSAPTGSLSFPPGQRVRRIAVEIRGDRVREPNETLQVTLSGNVNATIRRGIATLTILNDDAR
jgi:PKD repeat protein